MAGVKSEMTKLSHTNHPYDLSFNQTLLIAFYSLSLTFMFLIFIDLMKTDTTHKVACLLQPVGGVSPRE